MLLNENENSALAHVRGVSAKGVGAKQAAVYALGGKNAAPHRKNFCERGDDPTFAPAKAGSRLSAATWSRFDAVTERAAR